MPKHVYVEDQNSAAELLRRLQTEGVSFKGKSVLDIGCGTGTYSKLIAESGAIKVVGIDKEPGNIRFAKANAKNDRLHFICTTIEEFSCKERFDFLFVRGVIYYTQNLTTFLSCLSKIIQIDGELYITFIQKNWSAYISNLVKRIACCIPDSVHPVMINLFAILYYGYKTKITNETIAFEIIKSKMNTIFFPVNYLFSPTWTAIHLKKHHMRVLKFFPRGNTTDFAYWLKKNDTSTI